PRFREVFHDFDIDRVARMTKRDVTRLARDEGIIRHRGKIESTINNAQRALEAADEFGSLAAWLWSFAPPRSSAPRRRADLPATSDESSDLSKQLKRRGWSFVGPTTVYAMMQAVGMVNDHLDGCHRRSPVDRAQKRFRAPGLDV
ncbi:MAG: DNA-3-methyladenine glycosylase I, partial [Planctomycetota bacterium]